MGLVLLHQPMHMFPLLLLRSSIIILVIFVVLILALATSVHHGVLSSISSLDVHPYEGRVLGKHVKLPFHSNNFIAISPFDLVLSNERVLPILFLRVPLPLCQIH